MNIIERSSNILRASLAAGVSILVTASPIEAADLNTEIDFAIGSQPLSAALMQFADQSKIQVITASSSLDGHATAGVRGRLTVGAALNAILEGTGLSYKEVGDGTITIAKKDQYGDVSESSTSQLLRYAADELLLAQAHMGAVRNAESEEATASGGELALEEVVVTAQKREERLQDVPISISVLSGTYLDKSGMQGMTEALRRVPGVSTVIDAQGGGTTITLRGVGPNAPMFNGSSPIGYYIDSVPFGLVRTAIVPDLSIYDLERVEVLKGPQGTLYGASSVNGVVRVLTHDADLNTFDFKAIAETSTTKGGRGGYRGDTAVNVPIVEGKLAARAIVGYNHAGGWIDRPRVGEKNSNYANLSNVRLKLNAQPTEALSLGAWMWHSRNHYNQPSTSDANADVSAFREEPITSDFDAYGLKMGYDFSGMTLSSTSSYLKYVMRSWSDELDLGGVPPEFGGPLFYIPTNYDANVFAQEVLLSSSNEGPWAWSVGGFYRDGKDTQFQDILPRNGTEALIPAPINFTSISKSIATFGQVTREILDGQLELTGGLRYFRDRLKLHEEISVTGDPTEPLVEARNTFSAWTPRAVITWHPNDSMILYGSYSQGFRSGLSQEPSVIRDHPTLPPTLPDKLHNYEVGSKGRWTNNISYEVALFYINWEDVQQTIGVPLGATDQYVTAVVNGKSASGLGLEFSLSARPADGLDIGVNFSYNDLTFDEDVLTGGNVLFLAGDRLTNSPKYTAGLSIDYAFPLWAGLEARIATSGNYLSESSSRFLNDGQIILNTGKGIPVARASFGVSTPKHWNLTAFAENITNERGPALRRNPDFSFGWPPRDTRLTPRRIGLQLEYGFR